MRYAQGGGLTAERRAFREQIRLDAGEMFAAGSDKAEVAKVLRVHVRSVQRWRREWAERGEAGLVSKGPASLLRLSHELFVIRAYGATIMDFISAFIYYALIIPLWA